MKRVLAHLRTYVFRGFLASIPFGLSFIAIRLLYTAIDQRITGLIYKVWGIGFPGFGIVLLLLSLYAFGLIASNVLGRRLLALVGRVTGHIPLVSTTYHIGKQLADTLSGPNKQVFKRAVLVEYLKPGLWTTGFVTGVIYDRKAKETLLKVYVPTPPNPASGTMVIARESEVRDPGWTVEEALKVVMSGGILGPHTI